MTRVELLKLGISGGKSYQVSSNLKAKASLHLQHPISRRLVPVNTLQRSENISLTQNNSGSFRRQIRVPSSHKLTPHFSFTPQRDSFTIGHINFDAPVVPDERLPVLKPKPCSDRKSAVKGKRRSGRI